jgi:uncharacterized protein (TIGR00730 family)
MKIKRIAIFCGSGKGNDPIYEQQAKKLAEAMLEREIGLVFGGGKVGLMGVLADTMIAGGGETIGVIPDFLLAREVGHNGLSELIEVKSMHERKHIMADLADAFITLPGGLGTMDELCEILTWRQLGLHQCPVGVLNVNAFFDKLLELFNHMESEFFIRQSMSNLWTVQDEVETLLDALENFSGKAQPKHLDRS